MATQDMRRYEVLTLVTPEITRDEEKGLEKELSDLVSNAEGKVVSYDRWGKFLLAYPVEKHEYGIYVLMRFNVSPENTNSLLKNIEHAFSVRYNAIVMRHMFERLAADAPHEYKRPDSLEEGPTKDVNTFLKENKMSGAADSAESDKKQEHAAQDTAASGEEKAADHAEQDSSQSESVTAESSA